MGYPRGKIFGPGGEEIVLSGEYPQDRQRALDFAAQAREKKSVAIDPLTKSRAFLLVGKKDWPFPVPIVKRGSRWQFDAAAGLQELEYRRIGRNELDAIEVCRGTWRRSTSTPFSRATATMSTSMRSTSSAHPASTMAWPGRTPMERGAARSVKALPAPSNRVTTSSRVRQRPYHGYFYKVLKGQGPDAPLGEMDYVVKGLMIGGFALIAAPAEYGETGINTFIVSQDGVVYQKDLGA